MPIDSKYPIHDEIEIHPKGANIKKCDLCENNKEVTQFYDKNSIIFSIILNGNEHHLVCVKLENNIYKDIFKLKINNCPCCGRKL